jgi:hypothetical protein
MIKVILLAVVLVTIAVIAMAITILLKKGGRFPDSHIEHNPNMRKLGIKCAKVDNMGCNPVKKDSSCAGCEGLKG